MNLSIQLFYLASEINTSWIASCKDSVRSGFRRTMSGLHQKDQISVLHEST